MSLKKKFLSLTATIKLLLLKPERIKLRRQETIPVIVSLTSIPSRLETVHLTIRSLLNQSRQPDKIVLWLNDELIGKIPKSLSDLVGEVFDIRYVNLTCSHRKLVHSLTAFPDRIIVTCDDDNMYAGNWLERLYKSHEMSPTDIITNVGCHIARYANGELAPYLQWPRERKPGVSEISLMMVGWAGVLYPPGSLPTQTIDSDLFLKLAPRADDIWFKAMALLANTSIRTSHYPHRGIRGILRSQQTSLTFENAKMDMNRVQWQQCINHFNLPETGRIIEGP